ncbi:MAG: amidase family protein, partial [Myxococcota bacterium]
LGDNLAGNLRLGLKLTAERIAAAQRVRGEIWTTLSRQLSEVDVLITPTVAVPPFAVADGPPTEIRGRPMRSYIDWVAPTYLLTLSSLPILAAPCGLDSSGMPAGVQIVGPADGEEIILTVGAAIEGAIGPLAPDLGALLPPSPAAS